MNWSKQSAWPASFATIPVAFSAQIALTNDNKRQKLVNNMRQKNKEANKMTFYLFCRLIENKHASS